MYTDGRQFGKINMMELGWSRWMEHQRPLIKHSSTSFLSTCKKDTTYRTTIVDHTLSILLLIVAKRIEISKHETCLLIFKCVEYVTSKKKKKKKKKIF